ncbi:hypothetical protein IW492_11785 [Enterococcus sp. BWB1-3]|uniref:pectate lyase-like adhesive domain-containing protein n=1 Tax=Enterococcus sp. BWB1-3 TaxID=2787713 RepID=UPI0019207C11|nr:pectate lyase-like adhesive domain-containing protein [Enterococcus sp. BWB1-3]MBL1229913.1 hypothetical protein [Enterococcus sp. BWB1-3]
MKKNKKKYFIGLFFILVSLVAVFSIKQWQTSPVKGAEKSIVTLEQTTLADDEKMNYLKMEITDFSQDISLKSNNAVLYSEALLDALPSELYDDVKAEENADSSELTISFSKDLSLKEPLELVIEVLPNEVSVESGRVEAVVGKQTVAETTLDFQPSETIQRNPTDILPTALAVPYAVNPVSVTTWAELVIELGSPDVDQINLAADITATSNVSVNREVIINGQGHSLTMGRYSFQPTAAAHMIMQDFSYTATNSVVSGLGALTVTGKVESLSGNTGSIALMEGATIVLDAVDLTVDAGSSSEAIFVSKFFTVTNASQVKSYAEKFFGNYDDSAVGSQIVVEKQSQVYTHSMKGTTSNDRGQAWDIRAQADFYVKDQGTYLYVEGDGQQQASRGGIFLMNRDNSTINVLDGAMFDLHSIHTSAVVLMSQNGVFNVRNDSELNIIQDDDHGYTLGAALRFRVRGAMTFNIEENSGINIEKKAGRAAGIRMYGADNKVYVRTGSDFTVLNNGDGTARNPGSDGANQGIHYDSASGGGSEFNLFDEDSNVEITALTGAAIDAQNYPMQIRAEEGTYFVARGQTASASSGSTSAIFNSGVTDIEFGTMKYFDFTNTRSGGGQIFNNSTGSIFTAADTDVAFWIKGKDVTGNPDKSFVNVNFTLSTTSGSTNANLGNFVSGSAEVQQFLAENSKLQNMTRMNGNNQRPVVDELRVPTNADKYIWGHAGVPEGKHDGNRSAFTNEVMVKANILDSTGTTIIHEGLQGTIVEGIVGSGTVSVYGDDERAGIFRIAVPDDAFLPQDYKVEVTDAWRGDLENNKAHISTVDDIQTPRRTVLDVTPPEPAVLTDENLNNATKVLSGENAEAGATVYVYYDTGDKAVGTLLGTAAVEADGKWSFNLPSYLDKTKQLSVYLEDKAGKHTAAEVVSEAGAVPVLYDQVGLIKPPVTNTVNGNINPYNDLAYHDAVFKGVEKYTVADILPDQPSIEKAASAYRNNVEVANTQVGDTLLYTLTIKNNKDSSYATNWKAVVATDIIPDTVIFDPATAEVTVDGIVVTSPNGYTYDTDTRLLSVNLGDLATQESVVVTFKTTVGYSATGTEIENTAKAEGDSPRETPFVAGPVNPNADHETYWAESGVAKNPGGIIYGVLELSSAPNKIDFGLKEARSYGEFHAKNPTYDTPLIVSDSRAVFTDWTLTATVTEVMTSQNDPSYTLPNALIYKSDNGEETLGLNQSRVILTQHHTASGAYNVSENEWENKDNGFELKLNAAQYREMSEYRATILFTLSETY